MSLSRQPFFNTQPAAKRKPNYPEHDKNEHWTKTLARRPIGQKYGKGYPPSMIEIDFDNRVDNWSEPEGWEE